MSKNHDSDDESYDSDDYDNNEKDQAIPLEEEDQDIEEEVHKEIKKVSKNDKINITTEGVTQEAFPGVKLDKLKGVKQCHYCAKWYQQELIINNDEGQLCKHCLFWINYDSKTRLCFDQQCAKQGFGIAEYILECHETHDSKVCTRNSVNGGCFLCDFIKGKCIDNILNSEMLQQVKTSNTDAEDDDSMVAEFNDATKSNFKVPMKLVL